MLKQTLMLLLKVLPTFEVNQSLEQCFNKFVVSQAPTIPTKQDKNDRIQKIYTTKFSTKPMRQPEQT